MARCSTESSIKLTMLKLSRIWESISLWSRPLIKLDQTTRPPPTPQIELNLVTRLETKAQVMLKSHDDVIHRIPTEKWLLGLATEQRKGVQKSNRWFGARLTTVNIISNCSQICRFQIGCRSLKCAMTSTSATNSSTATRSQTQSTQWQEMSTRIQMTHSKGLRSEYKSRKSLRSRTST